MSVLVEADENDAEFQARFMILRRELQKLGWTEGQNIQINARSTSADPQRMRIVAAESIRLAPDALLTGSNQLTSIVSQLTHTIPIIFAGAGDAVRTGLVANMEKSK